MALTTIRPRIALRSHRWPAFSLRLPAIRPTRLLLAALVSAFALAMIYVLQIQSLVRLGVLASELEAQLAAELRQKQTLRIEMERLHDLATIERRALFDLDMALRDELNPVSAPVLNPRIDLSPPGWEEPPSPVRTPWWGRVMFRAKELLDPGWRPASTGASP